MKEISLTRGLVALVDDEDFEELNQLKWRAMKYNKYFRAGRSVRDGKVKHSVYMHRAIMGLCRGDGLQVDHKDLNPLNNQRENLRIATNQQNSFNTRSHRGTSKYKGVWLRGDTKKWAAQIVLDSKAHNLGCYPTEIEAAQAYDVAALKLHGEYAKLNFLKGNFMCDDVEKQKILDELMDERMRQQELWGVKFDNKNTANDWAAYICNYVASGAYSGRQEKYSPEKFRECLKKAAMLCIAAIEAIDRNGDCAPRHYEGLPNAGAKNNG